MDAHQVGGLNSVVVVGAGLAGIAAAVELADAGYPVMLLEQSSRLGGRAGSVRLADGTSQPVGSHLFLRCNTEYIRLLERLGTKSQVHLQKKLALVVLHMGKTGRFYATSLPDLLSFAPAFIKYPFLSLHDKHLVARALWMIRHGEPVMPDETFAQWLQRHKQSLAARRFIWELISAPTLNSPAEEASAALAMVIFRTAFFECDHGAALGFPGRDLSRLYATLPQYLKARGGEIRMNCRVQQVVFNAQERCFSILTKNGLIAAKAVVLAVPYTTLPRVGNATIAEDGALRTVQKLPAKSIVDVFLTYDKALTKHSVLAIPGLPALWVFPETKSDGAQELAVSISCPGELAAYPAAQIIRWTESHLQKAFGQPLPDLINARVIKHQAATFSTHPMAQTWRPTNTTSVPGLFLAGDYTATGLPATMEGAVRSGIDAAAAVIRYCRA
ncbi:MAG TPA: FAD-dependent oxidoreductase [Firmicutes bacterium]|jgi:squalene-associated FAD-dependent desaturase|nr:FAD-dependent oxidoreductase [Bacillota bacterium]